MQWSRSCVSKRLIVVSLRFSDSSLFALADNYYQTPSSVIHRTPSATAALRSSVYDGLLATLVRFDIKKASCKEKLHILPS